MEAQWKGVRTLLLENDLLRVQILADKGTDIVEFLYKPADIDFMWRGPIPFYEFPKMIPTIPSKLGSFVDYFPGGWQEIFPNAGRPCEYKGASLGLHGEVALLPWEYSVVADTPEKVSIACRVDTYRTPFRLEKTFTLKKGIPQLFLDEKVTNLAGEKMEFCWGHHPAFGQPFLSGDCVIKLKKAKVTVGAGDGKSFSNLKQTDGIWPLVPGAAGGKVDISRCPSEHDKVSEVIFLSDLAEGAYEIVNRKLKVGFKLEFPLSVFRCLWFWRVARGSFHYPWYGRTYNIALEPFSGMPVLSEAAKNGDVLSLGPGKSLAAQVSASVTTY